jgi:hypothetical protein
MKLDISSTHVEIIKLQHEMCRDQMFRDFCETNTLPWDFTGGYEPRWYNGPVPEDVKLLFLMAEPGAITDTERADPLPAIQHAEWLHGYDTRKQEHYWRSNLRELCGHVWPNETEENMYRYLGGSCTFWMSLRPGKQNANVPSELEKYFLTAYLGRFLSLFPNAVLLAAGGKARTRLKKLERLTNSSLAFDTCWAFTRPACNQAAARESWHTAGEAIRRRLAR